MSVPYGAADSSARDRHGPVGPRYPRDGGSSRVIAHVGHPSPSADRGLVRDAVVIQRPDHRVGRVRFPPPPLLLIVTCTCCESVPHGRPSVPMAGSAVLANGWTLRRALEWPWFRTASSSRAAARA